MKYMRSTIGFLVTLVVVYLLGAFANWDFNAGNWGALQRYTIGCFGVFLALGFASAVHDR